MSLNSDSDSSNNHQNLTLKSLTSQPSLQSLPSLTTSNHHCFLSAATRHHCLATLKGHTTYISSLTLAGKFLYSGSSDKEIRSWNRNPLDTSEILTVVAVGKGAVKSLVVSADKLYSAHQDHKIRVWKISNSNDQEKYTHLATLPTLGDRAFKILLPKNQIQIRRHKTCTWVHHVDTVSAIALSSDKSLLYSVSWDRTLKIWRTSDFKCLESVTNAHDDAINAIAVSDDGEVVYTGSADRKIKMWRKDDKNKNKNKNKNTHCLVATLEKHKSGINALALSSDGGILYSGASDRSIVVWQKDDDGGSGGGMVAAGALRGHTESILSLVVVCDLVCSGSADKSIRVWKCVDDRNRNYCCLAVLEGHRGPVKCLTATFECQNESENCYLIYSGSLDCDIKVWQVHVPIES